MLPRDGTMVEKPSAVRHQGLAYAMVAAILAAAAFMPGLLLLGAGMLVVLSVAGYFVFHAIDGDADVMALLWVALFPLGYYFLKFPREQAVLTYDRVAVLIMALALVFCPPAATTVISKDMRKAALAWFAFLTAALLSLVNVPDRLFPMRVWIDAFLFPAVLAWYVITCFPVRRYLRILHVLACVAAIYSAAIGVAELALGTDLLPLTGAGDTFAGYQDVLVLRVNGPYLSNNSFGLINLISFCLIWFLRSAIGDKMPQWQKTLNALGIAAAFTAAVLPLFRSIFITIGLILLLDLFRKMTFRRKALRVVALSVMAAAVLVPMLIMPELFQERVSASGNIYARLAQQKQNVQIFLDHPILGVGFANFVPAAARGTASSAVYGDVGALGAPHSNVGAVMAETGLTGFVPFAISNALLVIAFIRLRRNAAANGRLAWTFFMYVFLSYWISGLALTSGYYSDLNLWFMFSVAVIYKFALGGQAQLSAPLGP